MGKYKIGDHIIVEESNIDGERWNFAGKTGVIVTIRESYKDYPYAIKMDDNSGSCIWCKVKCLVGKSSAIKRVIFNDPATVIIWEDGTKTVAKAVKGDKYDPEKGFAIAYAKKFGGKTFREEMEKWCESVKPVAEVTLGGFKVGDRVSYNGHIGTVVCIKEGSLGVKMDEREMGLHDCGGFNLIAGDYPTGDCSRWLSPSMVKHVDENAPLTIEQLRKMDGKRVWLSRFDGRGNERFNHNFCGWHEVDAKNERLNGCGGFDWFKNIDHPYGFRAYLKPQTDKH